MNFLNLILLFIQITLIFCVSNYNNFHFKNRKGKDKKNKDECSCDCKQQRVIAVEKIVEIPRIQVVEDNDETAKNFLDFKLYKLAKGFNSFDQREIDKKEIKKLLAKEGIKGKIKM